MTWIARLVIIGVQKGDVIIDGDIRLKSLRIELKNLVMTGTLP